MTNIAIFALAFTVAAEPVEQPVSATDGQTTPRAPAQVEEASAPDAGALAAGPAQAVPAPALIKPAESEIEVLTEVVDLQEETVVDPTAGWYGASYPVPVRILDLPTARAHRAGGWELVIDHRSTRPIYSSSSDQPWTDMFNNFFGLDNPIRVGLGLRYGVIDDLDLGVYRAGSSTGTDTYEIDARFQAMHQADMAVDLAVRAGVTWFSQPEVEDATGFFGQLLASRLLANRVLLSAGAFYHSSSTNGSKYNQDKDWSVAAGGGAEVRLTSAIALDAEMIGCMAGYCSKNPTFSAGIKFLTVRHTFSIVAGNTTYLTADGYISNTDSKWSQQSIGFVITRSH
jgi:hypothetical protein